MCGIVGVFNTGRREPVGRGLLQRMTDAIQHRGPDGSGVFLDQEVGLGHRRLAIIDLSSAAKQPMATPDGRYVMTYNGEVYNYRELRAELETHEVRFRSNGDTEVVLQAFALWGEAAIERFNGMFAFAVWDTLERRLLLARDRYGVKPLYYAERSGTFVFASEIKALLSHPAVSAELDLEGLLEYFTFQNFFTQRSFFRGVRLLPPATIMTVSSDGTATSRRYWDFCFEEPQRPEPEAVYAEELERLLRQAVKRQLVSEVELGSYLSGGIDSGSLTRLATHDIPYMRTFTAGFDMTSASGLELGFDEREAAEHMSYLCRSEHYEIVLKAGDMERVLPSLTWHLEYPRLGQSYPIYYVAQLASKFVKVVLSGAGGDELFGGYPWRYYRAAINDDFDHYVDKYYKYWHRLIPNTLIRKVFAPVWRDVSHLSTLDIFREVLSLDRRELARPEDYVNHSLHLEARTFLHGLLVVEDKLAMAHSIETRFPFLDNDLVDFAMRVPVGMKLGNLGDVVRLNENEPGRKTAMYLDRTQDGKNILRKTARRFLPDAVTNRPKQGFSGPDASWFKGDSIDLVRRRLFDDGARLYQFLDRTAVRELVEEHLRGDQNRRLLIWSLLSFEEWCSTFL
jgi:asparagine synthase (glutamine-hydrolysing)